MTQDRIQRKLAAILAADVVAYSRLMSLDEAGTLARLKAIHRELLDPTVAKYGGRIFKSTGDGVLIEYPSAVSAVEHAVEVQREMAERNRGIPEEDRIEFRVGVNIGEVILEGDDVFGDGVNVAARLEQVAEPGGICLSDDACRQVQGKLDVAITDGGEQRLKNIPRPVRVYRIDPSAKAPIAGRLRAPRKRKRVLSVPAIAAAGVFATAVAVTGIWLLFGADIAREPSPAVDAAAGSSIGREFPIIAVLPFASQTGDQDQAYFADGVTEEVINALGACPSIRVFFWYAGE